MMIEMMIGLTASVSFGVMGVDGYLLNLLWLFFSAILYIE
jgi:hypothetical protein